MAHVSQADTTITQTDLIPALCGSVSIAIAMIIKSMPFVTSWM
jgi:hypothetical protein